jgi:transglutaminase-like putative cysteine protease
MTNRCPPALIRGFYFLLGAALLGLPFLVPGCRPGTERRGGDQTPKAAAAPQRETWETIYLQGSRVGSGRCRIFHGVENGQPVVRTEYRAQMKMLREGAEVEQDAEYVNVARPDGQLIRFESTEKIGDQPLIRRGRVRGNRLEIENVATGKTENVEWRPDYRGLDAVEQDLRARPLQPGRQRTLHALLPGIYDEAVLLDLRAGGWEEVDLPEGPKKLLHIDVQNQFLNGKTLRQTVWADRAGEIWKNQMEGGAFESFRTTKERALAADAAPKLDVLKAWTIRLDRPLPDAHGTKKIRYRLRLPDGDPAKIFPVGPTQQIRSLDANTAEITVFAVRPGRSGNPGAPADPPTAADRKPNDNIQSDDPKIVELARQAAAGETDPWRIAVALERFVKDYAGLIDYSQNFVTAAEVAKTRKGDCKAHAVLLAALCRANDIPARVAVGLVYCEDKQVFAYHMWTEAYIDGKWIPLDGTLGRGGIGAAHLKLGQSSLRGSLADVNFLTVFQVMGKLKIDVLEVDPQ